MLELVNIFGVGIGFAAFEFRAVVPDTFHLLAAMARQVLISGAT